MMRRKLLAVLVATLAWSAFASAETLPVSGNLELWLNAGAGVATSGSNVTSWADQSGNSHNATSAISPQYVGSAMNGLPVVRFNSSPMTFTPFAQSVNTTAFVVYNIDNSGPATQLILQRDSATQALYHGVFGTNNKRPSWYWNGAGQYSSDVTGNLITRWGFSASQVQIAVNGGTAENTGAPGSAAVGNWTSIGANGFGQDLKGDIAEMVLFYRTLNSAENQIVENHLSAKYALPMAANDHYAGDNNAQGDYDRGVFGVGRVDASNQQLSGSTNNGLSISTASLANGQWVFGGHKTATNSLTTDDVAFGSRMDRVWYLDATGNPTSTLNLTFDYSDAGLAAPASDDAFYLLYQPTNAFETSVSNFSVISGPTSLLGDQVSFSVDGASLADGYYTIGLAVPEPASFSAIALCGIALCRRRVTR